MRATGDNRGASSQSSRHPPAEDCQEVPNDRDDAWRGPAQDGYRPAGPSLLDEATIPSFRCVGIAEADLTATVSVCQMAAG